MPVETLENLRMLSNLETSTDKLIQIVLVGQPEFARKLKLNGLRQLRQRIAIRSTISPFTGKESLAYIQHRLAKAGAHGTSGVFTRGALRRIIKQARGIPRTLNILCDNGLITGFGYQKKPITARIVKEVIADFEGKTKTPLLKWVPVPLAAVLIISGLLIFSPYGDLLLSKLEGLHAFRIPQLAPVRSAPEPPPSPAYLPQAAQETVTQEQVPPAEEKKVQEAPETASPLTKTVRTGDTLYKLTKDVYGFTSIRVVERIRESNPGIKNVDKILIGTRIRFPEIPDMQPR
jgi:general secretion pathway protein A